MTQLATAICDPIGSRIGRFAIRARLGHGGMGEVFLADDTVLKRPVAMKAIKSEHSQDGNFHHRLLQEAERLSQINDEHIAQIHDVVEHEGNLFLVMEYVEGQTLRARLREPLSHEEFFSLADQCLAGLKAAHDCGILHCDLKPENLMMTLAGQVKILDFGFGRRLPSEASSTTDQTLDSLELSSAYAIGGTLAYMAPEVLLGGKPDQRSDIFSLGVVFSEALSGCHPFRVEAARSTAGRILQAEPQTLPATAPAGMDRVIARMLAKDPKQRYPNCAQVLADVRAVHEGRKPALGKTSRAGTLWQWVLAAVVTLVVIGVWLMFSKLMGTAPPVSASSRQLVVLPFKPAADDANSRAFSIGLTETLTAKLGQIADRYPLEIAPASEVRAQKVKDAQQARAILGATMVLEGSMQQSGSTVRVIYSLQDTRSLRQLHSGVITADASNPFAVQDLVITEVLSKLDIELAREDRERMQSHGTSQPQAYEAYLRGRGYLQGYDRIENLDNAMAAFQRSLQADPGFALAYAGLGQAYLQHDAVMHSTESLAQAQDACSHAAQLDGSNPDAEICLGMLFNSTGEYEKAAQHLERAVGLDGSRDESYRMLALAYEKLNRMGDAESLLKRAIAVRPQYWAGYKQLGKFYDKRGRYGEAVAQFKRVVELAPDSFSGYSNLGGVYVHQGDYAAAIRVLERSIAIRPTGAALTNLGAAYFYERRYQDAADRFERATTMLSSEYLIFGDLAEAYRQLQGKQEESRKNYAHALELAEQQLRVNARDGDTLLYAALYAAMLGQNAKAESYRKSGMEFSPPGPAAKLASALVLAQLHQDSAALAELDRALQAGLSATEITNNPAWDRFAAYPKYEAMILRTREKK
jgi:serine/threonine-protein kinase